MLIDGGTICLDNKDPDYRKVAHIGKGAENSTLPQTDVTITGGTICLIRANKIYTATDHLWLGTGRWKGATE